MKTSLKYGLSALQCGAIAWVLIARNIISNPASIVHQLGAPIIFNVLQFALIYLGIKTVEREKGDRPDFKEDLKTGVGISVRLWTHAFVVLCGCARSGGNEMDGRASLAQDGKVSRAQIAQAFVGLFLLA